jgi:predicted nuclease of predicted toxin-antitoxin system
LKIKVDEDLPKKVAEAVRGVVPDTLTVIEEGLSGILDPALWETVQREQRFLITSDKASCHAWDVISNHFRLLLRTGTSFLSSIM